MSSFVSIHDIVSFFEKNFELVKFGENSYRSNHVQQVMYDNDLKIIRSKVKASMKPVVRDVQIELDNDWKIMKGNCTCPTGQVRCHHMAATLLFAYHNLSVTDRSCSWVQRKPDKSAQTLKVKQLFPKPSREGIAVTNEIMNDERKRELQVSLAQSLFKLHIGFTWLLLAEPPASSAPHKLAEILRSREMREAPDKVALLKEQAKVSQDEIAQIERNTVGQIRNPLWLICKHFLLTASNFGDVLNAILARMRARTSDKFPPWLFRKILGTYSLEGVKAVAWGLDHEDEARKLFEETYNVIVEPCGLFLHESGVLGASPDGIIGDDTIVEIKCPYKMRNEDLEEALKKKKRYIVHYTGKSIQVNAFHPYYHQIQGQLHITGRKLCELIIWSRKGFVRVQIPRDEEWVRSLKLLLNFYHHHHMLPFILDALQ